MFLFRWIKNLVLFFLVLVGISWLAKYPYQGKPVYQHVLGFLGSDLAQEGAKDIKVLVGDMLKTLGEEIQEDVKKEEQEALEKLLKKETKENQNGY